MDNIVSILDLMRTQIYNFGQSDIGFNLKLLGWFATAFFGVLIVILIIKVQIVDDWLKTAGSFLLTSAFPKRHLNKSWLKISGRLAKNDEASLRLALIEADNLFDDLLKQMRLPGESMADRLRYLDRSQISNIDETWRAHKLRNILVHDHEYPITRTEIQGGVQAYERALRELEFID